jgi:hypothetical protein
MHGRLLRFQIELGATELEAAAGHQAENKYSADANTGAEGGGGAGGGWAGVGDEAAAHMEKLNLLLQSEALAVAAAIHTKGTAAIPLKLILEVVLPGMEQPVHTVAPQFDGAGEGTHPDWLKVVMRHSEQFEGSRHRTLIAPTWWGAQAGTTARCSFLDRNVYSWMLLDLMLAG